ncbi:MAG: VWA domain-containing protein, partial [Deltaproteobacteria bacterium]
MKTTRPLLVLFFLLAVGGGGWAKEQKDFDPRLRRNYEIVFDTSGSMSGKKLKIAKESLKRFLARLPAETYVGLIVFERGRPKEVL